MTFRLLSCDGGGIRGYLSSKLIQALNTQTNGKLLDNVQGFAGTSTGGLISIALAHGVSIDDLVKIYADDAATIFTKNGWFSKEDRKAKFQAELTNDTSLDGVGYTGSAYKATGLVKILTPYLHQSTMSDVDKVLAVNSAQLWDTRDQPPHWAPQTLNNCRVGGDFGDVMLIDAALATSAAPTYFPPHEIANRGYFADGGTFANDPVLNGIEVVIGGGHAKNVLDIEIISIGTGVSPEGITPSSIGDPLNWGVSRWLWPWEDNGVPATALLNLTLGLASQNLGKITDHLLNENMVRINPVLSQPVELDSYAPKDYKIMDEAIAAAQKSPEWKNAVNMVNGW